MQCAIPNHHHHHHHHQHHHHHHHHNCPSFPCQGHERPHEGKYACFFTSLSLMPLNWPDIECSSPSIKSALMVHKTCRKCSAQLDQAKSLVFTLMRLGPSICEPIENFFWADWKSSSSLVTPKCPSNSASSTGELPSSCDKTRSWKCYKQNSQSHRCTNNDSFETRTMKRSPQISTTRWVSQS